MNIQELRANWLQEEARAHIRGWDFSHIAARYSEEDDLPWDYREIVLKELKDTDELLDMDTGGGEFLRTLNHPPARTAATEGYPPNVRLCRAELVPLGIDFREMDDCRHMPFGDGRFDIVINRHGSFDIPELRRVLKPGGMFITQQVGEDNDRELVELLLPGTPRPFPGMNLHAQRALFEEAGFEILRAEECFRPIRFYDVGALTWFARIIEWEFPGFSVERCFDRLLAAQRILDANGSIEGRIHRYLIQARKPGSSEAAGPENERG